ncbi:DNA-directed RNA polymerase I subunit rpa49-like protein [Cladobotryum mycophilum]|uniref:DNA-directed RNA polymerase I subunit rpa49-like protein n=1 Tax=Cladobotryum mycophilum TaxID=491253 RepID=A0ABR0SBL3_9HYPO
MSQISDKKRKRGGDGAANSKKKVVIDAPPPTASVSSVLRPKFCPPVIAVTPGVEMPKDLVFHSYVPKDQSKPKTKQPKHAVDRGLLLHSTSHRSLDYTAKEEESRDSQHLLNHYIGVYDPETGKLQVVEAKKMIVRGAVRSKQAAASSMGERDQKTTMMEQRTDLGQTFGTKKARKVIQERVLNALTPQTKNGDDTPMKIDDASKAILESVGKLTSTMATKEELQAVIDDAKPIPSANLDASEVYDVYNPKSIIGSDILNLVPILEWQEKAKHKESIQVPSQFIASRVNAIATNDTATERLRVMRYMAFVIIFFLRTAPGKERGTRRVPPKEKLREFLSPAPDAVIENIRRKFSDAGTIRKFHIDLLMAHCCVFALIVDNFEVDTEHLRYDLRLDQRTMSQYFYEIGARVKPVKTVSDGRVAHIAKLVIPLDFPKQRQIRARR